MDLVCVTLLLEDEVARGIEDVGLMLVVHIDGADPALSVNGDGSDTTSALGDLDSLLLLACAGIPCEDGWLGAALTGDGSLALWADADAQDIIGVMILVVGDVLGSVFDLTATEEFLGVGLRVKNDTESSGHVDSLAVLVPVDVLLGVSASVTINVLEVVLSGWLVVVHWVVIVGFNDLSKPWTDGHELLTLSFFHLEEVILAVIFVLSTVAFDGVAGLLVVLDTAAILGEIGVVGKFAWCLSG